MADLDKVIEWLEKCVLCEEPYCNLCPYHEHTACKHFLMRDALELMKAYAKTDEEKQAERKQKRREWQAKYRESHRQQAYQATKAWRKNNPEKLREQKKRYREKRKQLGR